MFYHIFLGDTAVHPTTYDVCSLVEEESFIRGADLCIDPAAADLACCLPEPYTNGFQ